MNQAERTLTVKLAHALLQTNMEFAFYRRASQLGNIPTAGHPDFEALERRFVHLISDLEKSIAQEGNPAEDLYRLVQEVLRETDTLRKS